MKLPERATSERGVERRRAGEEARPATGLAPPRPHLLLSRQPPQPGRRRRRRLRTSSGPSLALGPTARSPAPARGALALRPPPPLCLPLGAPRAPCAGLRHALGPVARRRRRRARYSKSLYLASCDRKAPPPNQWRSPPPRCLLLRPPLRSRTGGVGVGSVGGGGRGGREVGGLPAPRLLLHLNLPDLGVLDLRRRPGRRPRRLLRFLNDEGVLRPPGWSEPPPRPPGDDRLSLAA